jgi:HEAT repeat protein
MRTARTGFASAVALVAGLLGGLPRAARADELEDLLIQLRTAKDAKAVRAVEDRLRETVKPEHANRLLAALSPPSPLTAPLLLDLLGAKADGPATAPALKKLLKPEPAWFEARVLAALARLGDDTAVPQLAERADDIRLKPQDQDEYLAAICQVAERAGDNARQSALLALGMLKCREGLGALVNGLTDPAPETRRIAQAGLQRTLEALFPYLRFDFKTLGYSPDGGTDETRRKAADSIRNWLITSGLIRKPG